MKVPKVKDQFSIDLSSPAVIDALQKMFDDGVAQQAAGEFVAAEASYRRVLAAVPGWADAWNNLGGVRLEQGDVNQAVASYQQAIACHPNHVLAHCNLGKALHRFGDVPRAIALFQRAIELDPSCAQAHLGLGNIDLEKLNLTLAAQHFTAAVKAAPDLADAHNNLGIVYKLLHDMNAAEASHRRAITLQPGVADFHNNLGLVLEDKGDFEQAIRSFREAIALQPAEVQGRFNLSQLKRFTSEDADLLSLKKLVTNAASLTPDKAALLHFALAKAMDDLGQDAKAFDELVTANRLKRSGVTYSHDEIRDQFARIQSVFDSQLFDRHRGDVNQTPSPIFVLGMPRSGSTLVEQILASHPQIHGAGELLSFSQTVKNFDHGRGGSTGRYPNFISRLTKNDLSKLATAYLATLPQIPDGKSKVVDKMPGNFIYVGLIHLIFPNARIIHTVRCPVDTCFSCYSKHFAAGAQYSYELVELGGYYRLYAQLMDHWRKVLPTGVMLDQSYEALVDDLEGQARRLVDHCGLQWDPVCLKFHNNTRPVATISKMSVRQPIYRSSIGRWKRFAHRLGPLLAEIESVAGDDR